MMEVVSAQRLMIKYGPAKFVEKHSNLDQTLKDIFVKFT